MISTLGNLNQWRHGLSLLILLAIAWLIRQWYAKKLDRFKGPFLSNFTDFWRYWDVRKGRHHATLVRLHRKHGNIVRIGPKAVSIAAPEAIPLIYGINRGFIKGDFYDAFRMVTAGEELPMLFTIKDEQFHQKVRKPIAKEYTMSALLKYEPLVDNVVSAFIKRLHYEAQMKHTCEMDKWVQYFAFDVITKLTFGESFGFMEAGKDLHDLIRTVDEGMDRQAPNSQMPWLGHLKAKLRTSNPHRQDEYIFPSFVRGHINRREECTAHSQSIPNYSMQPDFLDRFLAAKELHPKDVNDTFVWCYAITNVVAGSDTIAIPLRSILYYVISNPSIYSNLMQELADGKLSLPVSWKSAQQLPYLDAIVREALRIHPPVGLGLERVVPVSGLRLSDGTFFEPGTLVSMNAWVLHRSEEIFGHDAGIFRPERWLQRPNEALEAFQERLHKMQQSEFTFGFGPRTCIGKNLSLLEIYKVVPTLFLSFDMAIVRADWKTWNSWFVRQEGLEIQMDARSAH